MDFGEVDSTELEAQRSLEYYQLITGTFANNMMFDLQLPEFNPEQEYIERYTINLNLVPLQNMVFTSLNTGPFAMNSPYYYNSEILSAQAFQLNDKLVIGGFSYGANSIMTAPLPNQQGSYFDTYGSTMFMKYKVSKNVSIEGSISVGQRGHGPGF